ncbi:Respiratory supercomplex factor 1, mitochondrial [Smittium mucronatum]|uniref:Respiratory supercomplex factor 1, mitochondrial n=1 Tax=Smittium mucronatum TaxID=133383 RepID=A0A1R0H7N4_9FUNG|nr:Respiratory supercomplex factor 1, mitochondrial [Smittium mucronatum]
MKETASHKVSRKLSEEPLVMAGIGLTTAAFLMAAFGIYKRNQNTSQWGMRLRVLFQGLTVSALVWYAYKNSKEDFKTGRATVIKDLDWIKLERQALNAEKAKLKPEETKKSVFAEED